MVKTRKKIYWLSASDLDKLQSEAMEYFHGNDAEIIKDFVPLEGLQDLNSYIATHDDGFVYAVDAPTHMVVGAALDGKEFGLMYYDATSLEVWYVNTPHERAITRVSIFYPE
ncbi:MAG: hypothetical protein WC805_00610 [Patescibacteria group bacterium]|jgi:hypothetical protein